MAIMGAGDLLRQLVMSIIFSEHKFAIIAATLSTFFRTYFNILPGVPEFQRLIPRASH